MNSQVAGEGLHRVANSAQATAHPPRVVKGLMDFNYSKSLQELGQYALDKSRLRVDLTYIWAV